MRRLYATLLNWFSTQHITPRRSRPNLLQQTESLEVRTLLAAHPLADAPDIQFEVDNDWGSGRTAILTLNNDEATAFTDWQLEFQYSGEIQSLWNAEVQNLGGGRYRITPPSWDDTLDPGESLAIGFVAVGTHSEPSDFVFMGNGDPTDPGDPDPVLNAPNQPSVSVLADAGSGGFRVTMNLWAGDAADHWKLYENGTLIYEAALSGSSTPQTDSLLLTDRDYGVFNYQVEVSNAAGTALSDEVVYVAGDASEIGIQGVDLAEQALQVTIDQATHDYTLTSSNEAVQFSVVTNNSRVIQAEMVDGNTLRITGLEAGRASLRIMDLDSGEERFIGIRVRTADGQLPGLPDYVTIGSVSEDTTGDLSFWQDFGESDATNKYMDSRYIYLNGGPITGWRSWDSDRVSSYVRESLKLGMIPQFVYYNIPDGGESYTTDLEHIQSLSYMESYFQDLKFALDTIRTEAGDELVQMIMEPDFIGYLMQNAGVAASDISAMTSAVYSSGVLQEGVDPQFDNTVTGLIEAINYSISKYAPNVEFGWQFNLWASPGIETPIPGTGIVHLTDTLGVEAGRAAIAREAELIAQYYMEAGILSYGAGFISLDKYGLDAGAENGAADDPAGSTWFWNSDHWNNYLLIVQTLTQTTDREMVLWQLPVGHINDSLAENPYDENSVFDPLTNTTRQYEDSAPTFFLGDTFTASGDRLDYFSTNALNDSKLTVSGNTITWGSHMEEARAAGIRQILFGAGVGISTDSIGTEPTDDYWWITKVQEYYQDPVALDGTVVEPPEEVIPVVSISGATVAEGESGSALASLTISLSEAATQPVAVNYQTSNGTATAGEDYEASSGQVSFAVGETSKTISVSIYGDTQVEADEQFYVTLSSPVGAVLDVGTATATNTITNDDVVTNENETAVTTPFETAVTISIGTFTGDPDFGSHVQQYVDGTLLPSQYSQQQLDQIVGNYYDQWKSDWLRVDPGGNGYRVVMDSQGRTTSEAQGYGMLVLAHMDGYDPDAQTIFDGLFRYSRANPSEGNPDLMDWAQPDAYGNSSAFDGDADIAYALLVADAQWGSTGEINYLQEAITIINAMYESTIGPQSHLPMLGDWVDPNGSQRNQWSVRTSDFMYGHFRAFEAATQTGAWDEVISATQDVMTKLQQQSGTGLVPDFVIVDPLTGDVSPAPAGFLEVNDQYYWYNAGRVPWRLGTDAVLSGDAVALAQAQMLSEFFQQSSGGDPSQILGGYQLDGTPLNSWSDPFFRAAVGVSAMTGSDAADQSWLNSVFDSVATTHSNYYADSVSMLSMLVMSGNYINPASGMGSDGLSLQSFIQPAHGQVVDNQDGTLTYTPDAEFSGSDSFVYTTVSESGSVTTTTVSVTVEEYVAVVPEMAITDVTVTEGDSGTTQAVFTVTLDQPTSETVTVQFHTEDGTAVAGVDYQADNGQLVFQPGETEKTITVLIAGDVSIEPSESFQVVLDQVVGATLSSAMASGTILDNDAPAPTSDVTFTNVNDWGSGFQGEISIQNESENDLESWTLEFTFAGDITDIWNAEIVSHVGDTYVIRGASWNTDILAGGMISFGFIASPGGLDEPLSDFVLNGSSS
jgi:endo-1,4-beta-D-glucanase Y